MSAEYMLLLGFGISVVMQCSFFAVAFLCQFDKVTDLAGTLNFFVLAIVSFVVQGIYSSRTILATSLVCVWAVRLGSYLLARVISRGKDERFDEIRSDCLRFFGFWVFQIIWVFIVSVPVLLINSADDEDGVAAFGTAGDIVGVVFWALGFVIECVADFSKDAFYKDKSKRGTLLRTGVWKYSRHPNYFGEILCWTGIFLLSLAPAAVDGQRWIYVGVVSPLITFVLLMFISGVPPAEDRYDSRFGLDPSYLEYKQCTSPLILMPPSIYGKLPDVIKTVFFLEFPMYSRKLHEIRNDQRTTSYNSMA